MNCTAFACKNPTSCYSQQRWILIKYNFSQFYSIFTFFIPSIYFCLHQNFILICLSLQQICLWLKGIKNSICDYSQLRWILMKYNHCFLIISLASIILQFHPWKSQDWWFCSWGETRNRHINLNLYVRGISIGSIPNHETSEHQQIYFPIPKRHKYPVLMGQVCRCWVVPVLIGEIHTEFPLFFSSWDVVPKYTNHYKVGEWSQCVYHWGFCW